jgi:hypothetical protein
MLLATGLSQLPRQPWQDRSWGLTDPSGAVLTVGSAVTKPRVGLRATVAATRSGLGVDYVLTNADTVPVVAFTGLPAHDTTMLPVTDPDAVYVTTTREGFVLSRRVVAPPQELDPAAYVAVRGVVLAPGESRAEHLDVVVPLTRRLPYAAADERRPTLVSAVRSVRVCVGAARRDQVEPAQPPGRSLAPGGILRHGGILVPRPGADPVFLNSAAVAAAQLVVCSPAQLLPG